MVDSRKGTKTVGLIFAVVLVPLALYVANTATDLSLAVRYLRSGDKTWFGLTLGFVLAPSLIIQLVSLFYERKAMQQYRPLLYILHVLQLGVFIQYGAVFLHLWLGLGGGESGRVSPGLPIIHLTEAVLQSIPQLSLQLYITVCTTGLFNTTTCMPEENAQPMSAISTDTFNTTELLTTTMHNEDSSEQEGILLTLKIVSMSVSLVAAIKAVVAFFYDKCLTKENLSTGKLLARILLITVWKLCELCARAFVVGLFATILQLIVIAILATHWLILTIVVITVRDAWFTVNMLMCGLVAAVDTFSITWSIFYKRTFWLNTVLTLLGNIAMALGWYYMKGEDSWYGIHALTFIVSASVLSAMLGIAEMILEKRIKCHCQGEERQSQYEMRQ
ncbi:XK [Branchiostoma lanceolatum]|uniref:XK-related protein n=1 Tax=Branchiostoma lanceolatum TaxID=7740 RepID=A0A8J9VZW8_BRALA|nr:XK [Branchiostoma lanceolatum]